MTWAENHEIKIQTKQGTNSKVRGIEEKHHIQNQSLGALLRFYISYLKQINTLNPFSRKNYEHKFKIHDRRQWLIRYWDRRKPRGALRCKPRDKTIKEYQSTNICSSYTMNPFKKSIVTLINKTRSLQYGQT